MRLGVSYLKSTFIFCIAALLTVLPVLSFNTYGWYPPIVFFKWLLVFPVIAYGSAFCGFLYAFDKGKVTLGTLEFAWLLLGVFFSLQPFFIEIRSFPEWVRNMYFFLALGGGIFLLRNLPLEDVLDAILRALTAAGGFSTLFAFMQQSRFNGYFPFILNTSTAPDRFMGNTGIDSILGVYLAVAVVSGVWLLLHSLKKHWTGLDLLLICWNILGLWKAGSRSAFAACALGLLALFLAAGMRRDSFKKVVWVSIAVLLCVGFIAFLRPDVLRIQRRDMDALKGLEQFSPLKEGRFAIWAVSWEMIKRSPITGVGLGNYKWNYLEAMADFYKEWALPVRYTYWAHNEYLQWWAETGLVGVLLMLALMAYVALRGLRCLAGPYGNFIAWSLAACVVLCSDSLFSRPFHHADTAFIFSLALAVLARFCLPVLHFPPPLRKAIGIGIIAVSASGLWLFAETIPAQRYLGKYYYRKNYVSLSSLEKDISVRQPLMLQDAYQRLIAREAFTRAVMLRDEKNIQDALLALEGYVATQPRFPELNRLMLLYLQSGEGQKGQRYLRFYPPEEREKYLNGTFDGTFEND